MIIVSTFYVVCWLPSTVHFLIYNVTSRHPLKDSIYYAAVFLAFFYICANPFIYAFKFQPVKRVLFNLIPARRPTVHLEVADMASANRPVTPRA